MLKDIAAYGKGLKLTFKHLFKAGKPYRTVTFNYPDEKRPQSPGFAAFTNFSATPMDWSVAWDAACAVWPALPTPSS